MEAASDADILGLVRGAFPRSAVKLVTRRPYQYATSAPIEEVVVRFADGREQTLLFKDLARERLLDDARRTKPEFLYDGRRDVETYRRILAQADVGAYCYAAVTDPERSRYWLLLEKVDGVELWQIGELEIWEAVARWLARFHGAFAGRADEIRAANPFLLDYRPELFRRWRDRARGALAGSDDPRANGLRVALDDYEPVVDALAGLPTTFVHGEFYPSNVLVAGSVDHLRVCPVDWEMAATGPALLDLAALTGGWDASTREQLARTYHFAAGGDPAALDETILALDRCRLHLALQWVGWAEDWEAPPEHAHDWIDEALTLARRLIA